MPTYPPEIMSCDVPAWWQSWLDSYERHMQASNNQEGSILNSRRKLITLGRYLAFRHVSRLVDITQESIEGFLVIGRNSGYSPFTTWAAFGLLKCFFNWLVREGEIDRNPMERMKPPRTPESGRDVVKDEHISALLEVCAGNDFKARRDTAIIRMLLDTGLRISELLNIKVDELQMTRDFNAVRVFGKGGYYRDVPFGKKTAVAIDRYLRNRSAHPKAEGQDRLWLSHIGPLGASGAELMLHTRAKEANIPANVHPHLFRHTFAHLWLDDGGQEGDLRAIGGWRSDVMRRYGKKLAGKRAIKAHKEHSPGDKF